MPLCKMADLLNKLAPLGFCRDYLFSRHIENCPACRENLLSKEEAMRLLVKTIDVQSLDALWPGVRNRLREAQARETAVCTRPRPVLIRQWVAGAALFLVLTTAAFWLMRSVRNETSGALRPPVKGIVLDYIRIGGETADAIIYQPKDSDMIIVWAEKTL